MSFQGKYEIVSTLSEGESKSFRARQISSGRPVILHHLSANRPADLQPDLSNLVFEFLRTASKGASRNFLDMGDEEGRIFIVTADAPECLDLRRWLLAGIGRPAGTDAESPPAEGTDPRNIQLTHNFSTETLRQLARAAMGESSPASPSQASALKSESAKAASPGEIAMVPPTPVTGPPRNPRPTVFADVSENAAPAGLPDAPKPSKNLKESLSAELTAEFPIERRSGSPQGISNEAGANLQPMPGKSERTPDVGATMVFSSALPALGQTDTLIPEPKSVPQAKGLAASLEPAPEKTVLSSPTSGVAQDAALSPPENSAPRKLSPGFEMVFRSNKPRLHPTLSGAADPDIMATSFGSPTERDDLPPTPTVPGVPIEVPPAVTPPATAKKPTGATFDTLGSRSNTTGTTGSRAWQAPLETEQGTRPTPAASAPMSYTRMIENVKSLAGPLAPESPASGGASGSGAASGQGSYLQMPPLIPALEPRLGHALPAGATISSPRRRFAAPPAKSGKSGFPSPSSAACFS